MTRLPKNLGGLLLEWPGSAVQRSDVLKSAKLVFEGAIRDSKWELFIFESAKALNGEDIEISRPPFRYTVVCRRSGKRILVLSLNKDIVDYLFENILDKLFTPRLKKVYIAVDKLVKDLTKHPSIYALSFAHAKVPAFGASLRAVSFYGDDLSEAAMFREQLDRSVFFTCGLKAVRGGAEIAKLGNDASVSFTGANQKRLNEVELLLAFLQENGYLSTEFWVEE